MKQLDPVAASRSVITGSNSPAIEEQAQVAAASYGRIQIEPAPPDRATGLPMPAKDATFNNSGGYGSSINPGGPNDDMNFPETMAAVSGQPSSVNPEPIDFGHRLTPVPEDGFGATGSWSNIVNRSK